jgi:Kdo2-lipid IVA lauroyltransferase/acyltransferase
MNEATEKRISNLIETLAGLLGAIPRPVSGRICNRLGSLLFRLDRKHRRIALSNLRRAFDGEKSDAEIRAIAERVFQQLARILFEIGWSLRCDLAELVGHISINGKDRFEAALARGEGVLLLTAHAGNWELMPILAVMGGVPVSVLYRPLDFKPLDRFIRKLRSRFGASLIPTHRSARRVLGALHRGEAVALLMDQNVDWYEGVFVDFFGHRACTNKGLALIALKTGAPVLPVFMTRNRDGFTAEIGHELPLLRTGDKTKDLEANTQQYNDVIESFARRFPDQWFWVHQRWKTRPYHPWPTAHRKPVSVKR